MSTITVFERIDRMQCRRNFLCHFFFSVIFLFQLHAQVFAQNISNDSSQAITYSKHAFARSDYLIKPSSPMKLQMICSTKVARECDRFSKEMQQLIPLTIERSNEMGIGSDVVFEVRVFLDETDRASQNFDVNIEPNLQQAVYDDSRCAAMQFLKGYEVRKALVVVTLQMGHRLSQACVLNELARVSGLSFRQKFHELTDNIKSLSEIEFEVAMRETSELIRLHLDSRTHPGMTAKIAIEALGIK
jgi:hypothetical protein